ncbi:coiled-coil domain-containing protein 171-like [Lampris incognitus]|uniref:coiled-coil domain-containing protein 171-like n=1 Tax=Lampris incognitus TaxID=2546036 RepID=UPI0024B48FC6|nr:coiled-coil domain-containing protein 171-like [Lampris incognitus]
MLTEQADHERRQDRARRKDGGQNQADPWASHPKPAAASSKNTEDAITRLKEPFLQRTEQWGGARGRRREEGKGEGREESDRLRWRIQQLERDKLELTSLHNQETAAVQSQLARLRADVERGEAERQTLEYQLVLSRREVDQVAALTKHNHKLTVRAAELQQSVADLQKVLDITRQAREDDQNALQQEVEERDRLVLSSIAENDRLTTENQRLHQLLQAQEEALEALKRRIVEVEKEREKEVETVQRQISDLKYLKDRQERSASQLELSEQKVKTLESNIEAERAAHLESKFNSEIIQLRVRDLEAAVSVEKSGHQEALSSLDLLRDRFREVERAYNLEREKAISTTDTLDKLQKEYQQSKSDLSIALETEKAATFELSSRLEEEQRQHANTHLLLEQANQRQSSIEKAYKNCMKQIREILKLHASNTGSPVYGSPGRDSVQASQFTLVLDFLRATLSTYQHRLDLTSKEVQDLLCASEKLEEKNQTLCQINWDQKRQIEGSHLQLTTLKEEVLSLRQESSGWSTQNNSLREELRMAEVTLEQEKKRRQEEREREREEMEREKQEREREKQEMDRERKERTAEVNRITDLHQKESQDRLSFLYSLYQRLVAGCVLLDHSQSIVGTFSWVELCGVITEQANQLTSDLRKANDQIAHLESVCESKRVCVQDLQRSQECVLSRLEESMRQKELVWSSHRRELEEQHSHLLSQLHSKTERLSSVERDHSVLSSNLSKLRGLLSHSRKESASLRLACVLLAGALTHTCGRVRTLSQQKSLLSKRLAEREALEGEVRRLALALGEEAEEKGGRGGQERGRRRWRRGVCAVLALRRMCVLARHSSVLFRLDTHAQVVSVCVCGEPATAAEEGHMAPTTDKKDDDDGGEEGRGGVCVRWLRSKHLSSILLSSMTELQRALANNGSSHLEVMSAARSGTSRLLEHLLNQSDGVSSVTSFNLPYEGSESTLASRLSRGLSLLKTPQPTGKALVTKLQQHFLLFSQRLHSAEVERRDLRLEVAKLKRAARSHGEQRHEDLCNMVPVERFDSVCVELRQALNREDEAQVLLKEQSAQIHTLSLQLNTHNVQSTDTQHTVNQAAQSLSQCRQELRRKEQSLRILGKHLSEVQREKGEVEERLRHTEEELRAARQKKEALVNFMKTAETIYREVRDSIIQSRCVMSAQPLPPQLPRVTGAERIMGSSEMAACQSLLSAVSELYHAASSRIGWLEEEVSAHHKHVTALRSELQDACLRDNLAFIPVAEYSGAPPLVDPDAHHTIQLSDSLSDPPVKCSPSSPKPPRRTREDKAMKKRTGSNKNPGRKWKD